MDWRVIGESEFIEWQRSLSAAEFRTVARQVRKLQLEGVNLGEPRSRSLGGGLRELRFRLNRATIRVAYYFDADRTAVLLTVFRKTKRREDREVERARHAMEVCRAEHKH